MNDLIPREWLREKTTRQAVMDWRNAVALRFDPSAWERAKRDGFISGPGIIEQIDKFINGIDEGDGLWIYCSPKETWLSHCGQQGYAVVRNGAVIDAFVEIQN